MTVVAITLYISKIARKALKDSVPVSEEPAASGYGLNMFVQTGKFWGLATATS